MDPATFEMIVSDIVRAGNPEADVRVQGSRGHDQAGTDIVARFPDKTIWSLQCKRVERFGKVEIDKAVAYHSLQADRKFLVLSRTASPQAAAALQKHDGWTLWDKQDLSALIRTLPMEVQERLVDIYFRGQRMALLGRSEPGPWVEAERYFAPFEKRSSVFSHDWALVGRDPEIDALENALLADGDDRVVLLVGPGGIGKTRLLKEGVERFAKKRRTTVIRYLSSSLEPDAASLGALGTKPKLLVIDDAHDRDGLGLLIGYASDKRNKTRLLIATRPYAEQRIRNELGLVNIVAPPTVSLPHLEKAALAKLVVEVLKEFGGEGISPDPILAVASNSPLVAAMAARVVAREGLASELARGEKALRQVVLSRFTKVITGNLGSPAEAPLLRSVMEVLALIQPFHIDDHRIGELVAATHPGIDPAGVTRALKLLSEGGVIFKRGTLHRLMPDLLGDFLIEESCVGVDGKLTPFALAAFAAVDSNSLSHMLVNLGRMDWRLAGGDPSNSRLLEPLWSQLKAIEDKYDGRIGAVESVAYYQPAQALGFVQVQVEAGHRFSEFGTILRRVAMTPDYRLEALRLLLDLGREEGSKPGQNPSQPVRILTDLIGYDERKPLAFIEEVADFAFGTVNDPSAWDGTITPLTLLEPLLKGQGTTTKWTARGVSITPYYVTYDVVAHLRKRVIDLVFDLLQNPDVRIAHEAALFFNNAVRGPYGMMSSSPPDKLAKRYEEEFVSTIERLDALMRKGTLAPATLIGIVRSLSWHAEYAGEPMQSKARAVFEHLPKSLEFRLLAGLTDTAGWSFVGQIDFANWGEEKEWSADLINQVARAFEPKELADLVTSLLDQLVAAGEPIGQNGAVIDKLITAEPRFGDEIIRRAVEAPDSRLSHYLGYAIGAILENSPADGRSLITELLASTSDKIRGGAARALVGLRRDRQPEDVALLARIIGSDDKDLASVGMWALRGWRDVSEREMIDLGLSVPFDRHPELFDSVAALICNSQTKLLERLGDADVTRLLNRMKALPTLQGHCTVEVLQGLAKFHPRRLAEFLFERAQTALSDEAPDGFSVVGFSLRHGHLGFETSAAGSAILPVAWAWLRRHDEADGWVRSEAARIFAAMFKIDDPIVVGFMDQMVDQALGPDLMWVGDILRHAHHSYPFKASRFVERLLARCAIVDRAVLDEVVDQILIAATTGSWSGTRGQPTPRDVKARDQATEILARMSRLAPAYSLYRRIKEDAERNIRQSIREASTLDDDE
ncbi:AAA family ATPase [Novosphingobium sp. B-7]|uniref:AAA family ATPase n=1 Tax=Novosphingobium sp. B-7 TaxID=1298855 RepID=UPI00210F95F0|nr:AAA family ATPase [Novosphingobium sp. B-7]